MIAFMATLNGIVVNIAFDCLPGEFGENFIHCPLISGAGVLKSKEHNCVAEYPERCPEGGVPLVVREHLDLVVPRESIHKGHPLIASGVVHHDKGDEQWELILRAGIVEVAEVDVDADRSV